MIFADSASPQSVALLRASLLIAARRTDLAVVAVCDARRRPPGSHVLVAGHAVVAPLAMRLFDPARHVVLRRSMVTSVHGMARRAHVPLLVPPERDLNDPRFILRLRDELRAEVGLSLLVPQVFRGPLLAVFGGVVNFHPGRLPAYRGLAPTAWEVYQGEALGGFTFHLMTSGIDEGPVVLERTVPISDRLTVEELEWLKIEQAMSLLDGVFDALVRGESGRVQEQPGTAGYFGRPELRSVRRVEDPGAQTWPELELRLRAFGSLALRLGRETYWVTRLRRLQGTGRHRSGRSFTTSDGIRVEACRFRYLPLGLAWLTRRRYRVRELEPRDETVDSI